jgi:hypothetical protein
MAPRARFELATLRLTAECSTIELPGNRKAGTNGTEKVYRSAIAGVKQADVFLADPESLGRTWTPSWFLGLEVNEASAAKLPRPSMGAFVVHDTPVGGYGP